MQPTKQPIISDSLTFEWLWHFTFSNYFLTYLITRKTLPMIMVRVHRCNHWTMAGPRKHSHSPALIFSLPGQHWTGLMLHQSASASSLALESKNQQCQYSAMRPLAHITDDN